MPDDPRVQELLDELFDRQTTPEEVCGACVELLPVVRARWRQICRARAELDALLPATPCADLPTSPPDGPPLPAVPGYEVEAMLGRGGMGVVFRARHLRLNRLVALKMALAGSYAGPHERERFRREAEAVAALRHPNIVQVYDVGEADGRPYFTMEFMEGGTLAHQLTGAPQPARQAAELLVTLAGAVQAAHQSGIVHRDLKPGNVLLAADGAPKISDFGLARRLDQEGGLTWTGAPLGTPSYMAPEQAQGKAHAVGLATDVYALGAILYELLTGRPPFRGETAADTVQQVIHEEPAPPSRLNARVPRDLETVCLKCLRKQPQSRYATAAALAEDLDRFLRGEAIAARPESPFERLVRGIRRRPVLAIATLSVVVLAGGGLWMISERAATQRVATAERETTERAAQDDLRDMADELKKSRWPQARAALERAKGRLGDHGSPALRRLLDQGADDLELAARVEKIRMVYAAIALTASHRMVYAAIDMTASQRIDEEYAEAFRGARLGQVGDDPELVAVRVRESDIRNALVGALDDWSAHIGHSERRTWVLTVARMADTDPDPSGWRDRARDPAVRADQTADQAALLGVIRAAPVADQRVPLLLALAGSLRRDNSERLPFLKRIQQNHAGDFWANITLGDVMTQDNPVEAGRYFQAAVSIRPDLGLGYEKLGLSLSQAGLMEDATAAFQKAAELDPKATQHLLVASLGSLGRHDEALDHLRAAIAANPTESSLHRLLARILEYKGRYADALPHYRKAVALNPNDKPAQNLLRGLLVRLGQGDEARRTWRVALDAGPPRVDEWCGYTEFCLYLRQEDEYRLARGTLLADFGASTDPLVASRTARACLLLPATEDELRRAVVLAERAVAGDPSKYRLYYDYFLFAQGLADYRQGRFDRAIAAMRGEVPDGLGPSSRLVLAMALHQSGRGAEGRDMLKAAVLSHDWIADEQPDQNNWVFQVLRREAEGMMLPNLPTFLDGQYQPQDNDERLTLLGVCQATNRSLALARLYADIFRSDAHLAEDLSARHRYNAARAAAQAGCGLSKDSAGLGEPERRRWREQAREWLRADLAALGKLLEGGPAKTRDQVRPAVRLWRYDPALSGLRESTELEKLTADERKDCLALWHEVGVVLDRARSDR